MLFKILPTDLIYEIGKYGSLEKVFYIIDVTKTIKNKRALKDLIVNYVFRNCYPILWSHYLQNINKNLPECLKVDKDKLLLSVDKLQSDDKEIKPKADILFFIKYYKPYGSLLYGLEPYTGELTLILQKFIRLQLLDLLKLIIAKFYNNEYNKVPVDQGLTVAPGPVVDKLTDEILNIALKVSAFDIIDYFILCGHSDINPRTSANILRSFRPKDKINVKVSNILFKNIKSSYMGYFDSYPPRDLKNIARNLRIPHYSTLNRERLIKLLRSYRI